MRSTFHLDSARPTFSYAEQCTPPGDASYLPARVRARVLYSVQLADGVALLLPILHHVVCGAPAVLRMPCRRLRQRVKRRQLHHIDNNKTKKTTGDGRRPRICCARTQPAQGFPTVVRKGGVRAGAERDQTGTRNGEHREAERPLPDKDRRREEKASHQLAIKGSERIHPA